LSARERFTLLTLNTLDDVGLPSLLAEPSESDDDEDSQDFGDDRVVLQPAAKAAEPRANAREKC